MVECTVLGGSRGIGRAIASALSGAGHAVFAASSADVDTSDMDSVSNFARDHPETDVLVLNTGGPPPKEFADISEQEWRKYHDQLFLGFCVMLKKIKVRDDGYIFLISSSVIKEPSARLIMSSAYRAAFSSVFKILSKQYAARGVSCINIAPGPISTDRTRELFDDIDEYQKTLPMKRLGRPEEIGSLVKSIVSDKIKYLSGVTINFDGANSSGLF